MYSVYDFLFNDFPAKNTIHTPVCIGFWPTLLMLLVQDSAFAAQTLRVCVSPRSKTVRNSCVCVCTNAACVCMCVSPRIIFMWVSNFDVHPTLTGTHTHTHTHTGGVASEISAGGSGGGSWELGEGDLPVRGWPTPTSDMWSPFSSGTRCVCVCVCECVCACVCVCLWVCSYSFSGFWVCSYSFLCLRLCQKTTLFFVRPPLSDQEYQLSDLEYQIRSIRSGDATLFCASASVRR